MASLLPERSMGILGTAIESSVGLLSPSNRSTAFPILAWLFSVVQVGMAIVWPHVASSASDSLTSEGGRLPLGLATLNTLIGVYAVLLALFIIQGMRVTSRRSATPLQSFVGKALLCIGFLVTQVIYTPVILAVGHLHINWVFRIALALFVTTSSLCADFVFGAQPGPIGVFTTLQPHYLVLLRGSLCLSALSSTIWNMAPVHALSGLVLCAVAVYTVHSRPLSVRTSNVLVAVSLNCVGGCLLGLGAAVAADLSLQLSMLFTAAGTAVALAIIFILIQRVNTAAIHVRAVVEALLPKELELSGFLVTSPPQTDRPGRAPEPDFTVLHTPTLSTPAEIAEHMRSSESDALRAAVRNPRLLTFAALDVLYSSTDVGTAEAFLRVSMALCERKKAFGVVPKRNQSYTNCHLQLATVLLGFGTTFERGYVEVERLQKASDSFDFLTRAVSSRLRSSADTQRRDKAFGDGANAGHDYNEIMGVLGATRRAHRVALTSQVALWRILSNHKSGLQSIYNASVTFREATEAAKASYLLLVDRMGVRRPEVLSTYSLFLEDVMQDRGAAQAVKEELERTIDGDQVIDDGFGAASSAAPSSTGTSESHEMGSEDSGAAILEKVSDLRGGVYRVLPKNAIKHLLLFGTVLVTFGFGVVVLEQSVIPFFNLSRDVARSIGAVAEISHDLITASSVVATRGSALSAWHPMAANDDVLALVSKTEHLTRAVTYGSDLLTEAHIEAIGHPVTLQPLSEYGISKFMLSDFVPFLRADENLTPSPTRLSFTSILSLILDTGGMIKLLESDPAASSAYAVSAQGAVLNWSNLPTHFMTGAGILLSALEGHIDDSLEGAVGTTLIVVSFFVTISITLVLIAQPFVFVSQTRVIAHGWQLFSSVPSIHMRTSGHLIRAALIRFDDVVAENGARHDDEYDLDSSDPIDDHPLRPSDSGPRISFAPVVMPASPPSPVNRWSALSDSDDGSEPTEEIEPVETTFSIFEQTEEEPVLSRAERRAQRKAEKAAAKAERKAAKAARREERRKVSPSKFQRLSNRAGVYMVVIDFLFLCVLAVLLIISTQFLTKFSEQIGQTQSSAVSGLGVFKDMTTTIKSALGQVYFFPAFLYRKDATTYEKMRTSVGNDLEGVASGALMRLEALEGTHISSLRTEVTALIAESGVVNEYSMPPLSMALQLSPLDPAFVPEAYDGSYSYNVSEYTHAEEDGALSKTHRVRLSDSSVYFWFTDSATDALLPSADKDELIGKWLSDPAVDSSRTSFISRLMGLPPFVSAFIAGHVGDQFAVFMKWVDGLENSSILLAVLSGVLVFLCALTAILHARMRILHEVMSVGKGFLFFLASAGFLAASVGLTLTIGNIEDAVQENVLTKVDRSVSTAVEFMKAITGFAALADVLLSVSSYPDNDVLLERLGGSITLDVAMDLETVMIAMEANSTGFMARDVKQLSKEYYDSVYSILDTICVMHAGYKASAPDKLVPLMQPGNGYYELGARLLGQVVNGTFVKHSPSFDLCLDYFNWDPPDPWWDSITSTHETMSSVMADEKLMTTVNHLFQQLTTLAVTIETYFEEELIANVETELYYTTSAVTVAALVGALVFVLPQLLGMQMKSTDVRSRRVRGQTKEALSEEVQNFHVPSIERHSLKFKWFVLGATATSFLFYCACLYNMISYGTRITHLTDVARLPAHAASIQHLSLLPVRPYSRHFIAGLLEGHIKAVDAAHATLLTSGFLDVSSVRRLEEKVLLSNCSVDDDAMCKLVDNAVAAVPTPTPSQQLALDILTGSMVSGRQAIVQLGEERVKAYRAGYSWPSDSCLDGLVAATMYSGAASADVVLKVASSFDDTSTTGRYLQFALIAICILVLVDFILMVAVPWVRLLRSELSVILAFLMRLPTSYMKSSKAIAVFGSDNFIV